MNRSLATPPAVGIVGAGQLARMLIEAAIPLGVTIHLLAADPDDAAALVSPNVVVGSPAAIEPLLQLARVSDVLTFDHELVDVPVLRRLEAEGVRIRPSAETVAIAQDKGRQRALFAAHGFPMPAYRPIRAPEELVEFGVQHGWPVVAKAERGGYDGRGVWLVNAPESAKRLAVQVLASGTALLVEERIPIDCELAVLVARRPDGEAVVYPVVETVQREGICHEVIAPAPIPTEIAAEVRRLALAVAEAVKLTGVLALELFLANGALTINEIAARPHNSGHYTIEGCVTSQFENHLRAVLDLPLGVTDLLAPAVATANVLAGPQTGNLAANLPAALAVPGVRVHLYGKAARPGRKVGHVTALGAEMNEARGRALKAASLLSGCTSTEVPV